MVEDNHEIYTWHFSDGNLANGDGREIVPGMALACKPDEIELCRRGFHSSLRIIDALQYAPGNIISYCAVGGKIIYDADKLVSSQRRHIHVIDAERILHEFAVWCAEQALSLIANPDPRSIAALTAKREWLDGKINDHELEAARVAAWVAAGEAASAAASAAARAAAWVAAWEAQNIKLEQMVMQAINNRRTGVKKQ